MSDNQNDVFCLKVSPHSYENVHWKHQTFKKSYGTWNVSILRSGSSFSGSVYLETLKDISLAELKLKVVFKYLIYSYKVEADAKFDSEDLRFYFNLDTNSSNRYHYEVDVKIDDSLCSEKTQTKPKPTSEAIKFSKEMFESGKLADVIIKTKDGNEIAAHQFFLMRSKVFEAMLNADMLEAQQKVIQILDIDHDVLIEMVRYLYCDEVPKIKEMAIDLLVAADKYNIQGLVDTCVAYLLNNVTMENHGRILAVADQHAIKSLKESAIEFIVENRKEIFATESWKELKKNNLQLALEVMEKNMSIS